jgi:hypothetical protein
MSQAALFVERDTQYVARTRKLRGTMTREEWHHPGHRQAAITAAAKMALAHIKQSEATAEPIAPVPVILYCSPTSGAVIVADIGSGRSPGTPIYITSTGDNLIIPPPIEHAVVRRTTYARWAEGPLPHVEMGMLDAPQADMDPELQRLRAQNPMIRKAIDTYLRDASNAQMPRMHSLSKDSDLIDFRIRWVFRCAVPRMLDSKQATSAKMITHDGVVDLGEDGMIA